MGRVTRQADANIQPGKRASATDVAAELNHYKDTGINDNSDRIDTNILTLVSHGDRLTNLSRGVLYVTTKNMTAAQNTVDVGDGGLIVLTVTNPLEISLDVPSPLSFEHGQTLTIVCSDDSTVETWSLECDSLVDFADEIDIHRSSIVRLVKVSDAAWSCSISAVPQEVDVLVVINGFWNEFMPIGAVNAFTTMDIVLDGNTVGTSLVGDFNEANIDLDAITVPYGVSQLTFVLSTTGGGYLPYVKFLLNRVAGFNYLTVTGAVGAVDDTFTPIGTVPLWEPMDDTDPIMAEDCSNVPFIRNGARIANLQAYLHKTVI